MSPFDGSFCYCRSCELARDLQVWVVVYLSNSWNSAGKGLTNDPVYIVRISNEGVDEEVHAVLRPEDMVVDGVTSDVGVSFLYPKKV